MGVYAVTGSASGMGRASADLLRAEGHTVIGVDLAGGGDDTTGGTDGADGGTGTGTVVADLSTPHGRAHAAAEVLDRAGGALDGAVLAAGVGPGGPRSRCGLIAQLNYSGTVELLERWRPALAESGSAKVVVVASNSATTTPLVPSRTVRALLAGDPDRAARSLRVFGPGATSIMYAASKIALSRWVRRTAVRPEWARAGIRLNAIAPGAVLTPLLRGQLDDPRQGAAVRRFPIPTGEFGDPAAFAAWIRFMLSDAAAPLCGSVVTVDGGTDAALRADDWPRRLPARRLPLFLRLFTGGNGAAEPAVPDDGPAGTAEPDGPAGPTERR